MFYMLLITIFSLTGVYQPLKRKSGTDCNEVVEASECTMSPGCTGTFNSPLRTPVSRKGGRTNGRSKVTKNKNTGPQTPISNTGEIC